jgi:hypothetical protein
MYDNSTTVVIDFNDEGSLKRALIRTLGTAEALKPNVTRDVYEMWRDRIFDAIRQCRMETITREANDEDIKEFNTLLDKATTNRSALSNIEIQIINQARACYSFMRDQIESQLMISIKNIHVNGNPLDLIRALKTKFSPATQVTVFQSLQNLLSVKLIASEPKNDFINRIRGLYHNVLHYNQTKTVEQLLDVLLNLVLYQNVEPNYQQQLKRDLYNDVNFSFIQAAKIVLAEEELVKLAKDKANNNINNSNLNTNSENKSELKANATFNTLNCEICKRPNHDTSDCFYNLLNENKPPFNHYGRNNNNNNYNKSYNSYKRKMQKNNNISDNDTNELTDSDEESENNSNLSYRNNKNTPKKNKIKRVKFRSNLKKYNNNNNSPRQANNAA